MSTNGHRPRNIFNAVACAATLVASVAIAQPRPASAPVAVAAPSVASPTLNAIKARGQLICGVGGDRPGFGFPDARGVMRGFDADVCRSIAAAIFGNPDKVRFVSLTSLTRFPSLQSGEVDIVARFTTWTLTREAQLGLEVPAIHFYDGQGFLVKKKDGIKSAHDLGRRLSVFPARLHRRSECRRLFPRKQARDEAGRHREDGANARRHRERPLRRLYKRHRATCFFQGIHR
ncbi:transporter substrate-binding domain-containing protein [Rhodoferax koreense]|uniref:transporter substrate-binding domain-containing protein n=1 Tax=Rhodoferax koreensis TaxID=1842727 RepID=UPI00373FD963